MKLIAYIDIETEVGAGDAIPPIERAIYDALDGLYIDQTYAAGSVPITEITVTIEEGDT